MKRIEKKVWPECFERLLKGEKNYEVRLADFEVRPGDILILKEYDPKTKTFSGREIEKEVTYYFNTKACEKFWSKEDIEEKGLFFMSLK